MKRIYFLFVAVLISALGAGCRSAPTPPPTEAAPLTVPAWLNELPPEDAFWGIGLARLQNESLAMQTATSRARRDIAEQISVEVQGLLTDFARESGLANNSRSILSIDNITRELVDLNLAGATPNIRDRTPDGTWWVRVSISKADAKREINRIVNHEMADFAEWQAERALQMLDFQLDRRQSRPTVRSVD